MRHTAKRSREGQDRAAAEEKHATKGLDALRRRGHRASARGTATGIRGVRRPIVARRFPCSRRPFLPEAAMRPKRPEADRAAPSGARLDVKIGARSDPASASHARPRAGCRAGRSTQASRAEAMRLSRCPMIGPTSHSMCKQRAQRQEAARTEYYSQLWYIRSCAEA